jgi:hypothetical protein
VASLNESMGKQQDELVNSLNRRNAEYSELEGIYRNDIGKLESTLIRINLDNQSLTDEYNNIARLLKTKEMEINDLRDNQDEAFVRLKQSLSELETVLETERVQHRHRFEQQSAEYTSNYDNLMQRLQNVTKENAQLRIDLAEQTSYMQKMHACDHDTVRPQQEQEHQMLVDKARFLQEKLELLEEKCSLMVISHV